MNRRVLLAAVGAAIGVLLLWFVVLWGPQGGRLSDAKDRKENAERTASELELRVSRLQAAKRGSTKLLADLERLRVAIPDSPDLAQFILDDRCLLALAVHDAADTGLEQTAERLAAVGHAGAFLRW